MTTYSDNINQLTRHYNDAIRALEDSYKMEGGELSSWRRKGSSKLRREYSNRYEALVREYQQQCNLISDNYKKAHPEWAKWRIIWGWVIVSTLMLAFIVSCGAAAVVDDEANTGTASALSSQTQAWNADNIPIPYLQDASQYVSNPDSVLSQGAVDRMNLTLKRIENELDIQSVVVVVNYIENDDPFRMAQDIGNKYGVGRQNRGLVIVVGYLDHSINMSPGRALEADLTDAECHRLEQTYVVPAMRAEMPDSGMVYLVEAIYSTLQKKELPQMSQLSSQTNNEDDGEILAILGFFLLFIVAWGAAFLKLNSKYQWFRLLGAVALLPNPFYEAVSSGFGGGGFGGGGFHGGGGGGGFHGGSFGGGSFGGGGATSRW